MTRIPAELGVLAATPSGEMPKKSLATLTASRRAPSIASNNNRSFAVLCSIGFRPRHGALRKIGGSLICYRSFKAASRSSVPSKAEHPAGRSINPPSRTPSHWKTVSTENSYPTSRSLTSPVDGMLSVMNSLNILSGLTTTPPPSPPRSRTASSADIEVKREDGQEVVDFASIDEKLGKAQSGDGKQDSDEAGSMDIKQDEEKTPLLSAAPVSEVQTTQPTRGWQIPRKIGHAIVYGVKVVYTTIAAPGRYVIACFYDDKGHFSAILPLKNFKHLMSKRRRRSTATAVGLHSASDVGGRDEKPLAQRRPSSRRSPSVESVASAASSDTSDGETETDKDSPSRNTRSRTSAAGQQPDEIAPQKKSIRIKLNPDESLRRRKAHKAARIPTQSSNNPSPSELATIASTLKSPSSPSATAAKLTKYPRLQPKPPRPLVPRRQPSYTLNYTPFNPSDTPRKTLIIDLDETLIHSMAKGGRMSTGHMVEVRLSYPPSTPNTPTTTVPILYHVHERPACHEFLRKVAKWYTLVIFTASVQEYADPVIDWLERERKYFSARYYRQHCTFRGGAYIKDLAQVEADLTRVVILDNSPMSYIFHEDNAIPIEGWISDPTDNDLLHLIPLLEGLQYVTDVRALLALRQGLAQQA